MTDSVNGRPPPDEGDLTRVLLARAGARLAVVQAGEIYDAAMWEAFRTEIGTSVRRVSPLLVAVLEREALPLDEIVWTIGPARGWPFRPLSGGRLRPHGLRHALASGRPFTGTGRFDRAGVAWSTRDGGRVRMEVIDGGLELRGRIGQIEVATSGNVARLTVAGAVPLSVVHAAIGRIAASLVDIPFLRGKDWIVVAVERRHSPAASTFVIETGSRPYTLPWVKSVVE